MLETCPACGEKALFVSEAVYDGFTKTGEHRRCTSCGHVIKSKPGGTPKASKPANDAWSAFAGEDAPKALNLFDVDAETGRMCRKCKHYIVHPFTQRCGLHDKEVAATDTCDQFEAAEK